VLNPNVAIAVYRIAEEALRLMSTSLQARSIALSAAVCDSTLLVRISHSGGAMSRAALSNLPEFASMSHRISRLNGELTITPGDGATQWSIAVPIDAQG
jgi:glucose-6-phosphate-specific signal transduction histidine kinase